MSETELVIVVVAATLGAILQGSIGIGLALIAGPALVSIDPGFAPGPLIVCAQIIGLRHAIAERTEADRGAVARSLFGAPIGLGAGLLLLSLSSDALMSVLIGSVTSLGALALLIGLTVKRTPVADVVGGAAIALCTAVAGLPGPPAVILFSEMKPGAVRATIGSLMLFIAVGGLIALGLAGEFGRHELRLSAIMTPGVLLGLAVSGRVRPHLDKSWFRPTVLVVAFAGGLALIARQLF